MILALLTYIHITYIHLYAYIYIYIYLFIEIYIYIHMHMYMCHYRWLTMCCVYCNIIDCVASLVTSYYW